MHPRHVQIILGSLILGSVVTVGCWLMLGHVLLTLGLVFLLAAGLSYGGARLLIDDMQFELRRRIREASRRQAVPPVRAPRALPTAPPARIVPAQVMAAAPPRPIVPVIQRAQVIPPLPAVPTAPAVSGLVLRRPATPRGDRIRREGERTYNE